MLLLLVSLVITGIYFSVRFFSERKVEQWVQL